MGFLKYIFIFLMALLLLYLFLNRPPPDDGNWRDDDDDEPPTGPRDPGKRLDPPTDSSGDADPDRVRKPADTDG